MKRWQSTRRDFLKTALSTPFLFPSLRLLLDGGIAHAEADSPQNVIFFFTSNGSRGKPGYWFPARAETFSGWQTPAANVRIADLASLKDASGNLSGVLTNKLNTNYLTLVRGLDSMHSAQSKPEVHHNPRIPTTGWTSSVHPSIDQILAASPKIRNGAPLDLLCAMAKWDYQGSNAWSFKRAGGSIVEQLPEWRPDVLFSLITGSLAGNTADLAKLREKRLRVLDLVTRQVQTVIQSGSRALSKQDKEFLEMRLALLQDQRKKIDSALSLVCTPGAKPAVADYSATSVPTNLRLQFDNIVLALSCGITHVANVAIPETDLSKSLVYPAAEHHALSHEVNQESDDRKMLIERGYAEAFGYLIDRLNSVVDASGKTLLEKTLVVWANSAGAILNGEAHNVIDLPVLLASAHPRFNRGKMIDYRNLGVIRYDECCNGVRFNNGHKLGLPYNRLLVTVFEAMGLSAAEYLQPGAQFVGDPKNNEYDQYDLSLLGSPLPYLLKS